MKHNEHGKGKVAAVTGGTGFLGRYIVADLIKAGWKVRLLVRSDPIHPIVPDLDAEIILGDLSNKTALERLCAGADVVIHAAGLIKAKSRDAFFSVNSEGSANLAIACAKVAPNVRIVVVSSLAAREPALSDYAAIKRAGEAAVLDNAQGPVAISLPSAISGPWDKETYPLFQSASKGFIFGPKTDAARICLINVSDVSKAVVALTDAGDANVLYEVCDECVDGYTWAEIATAAGKAFNTTPRLVKVPPIVFNAVALGAQVVARCTDGTAILSQGKVREILHPDWGSSAEMQPPPEAWRAQVNLCDGFDSTAKWYRQEKWL